MVKIAFYDAETQEASFFKKALAGKANAEFIAEPLSSGNVVADADILSVFVTSDVTADLMGRFTALKHIACRSTGYDNVDTNAAAGRNVSVSNVPTYGEYTVAEYAFGLILLLSRKLLGAINASDADTTDPKTIQGFDLHGKTLGVIGAGRIGRHVIQIARGLGMSVVAYDPMPDEKLARELGFVYAEAEEVAAKADIVTVHAKYTADNRYFINEAFIKKMKHGAYLINTARGELVDTQALVLALEQKHLAGAALDVLEGEELLSSREEIALLRADKLDPKLLKIGMEIDVLTKMPQVIITHHNAYNTVEAVGRIRQTALDNIDAFLAGQPQNLVS